MGALKLQAFRPRHYVVASTDRMSEDKIRAFEKSCSEEEDDLSKSDVSVMTKLVTRNVEKIFHNFEFGWIVSEFRNACVYKIHLHTYLYIF